jgi:hypothetical protein
MSYSADFKLIAIKLYKKFNSVRQVSELLNCSKSSLQRWIERYYETKDVSRKDYKPRKSIITNEILNFITEIIKKNPTIVLSKIKKEIIKKLNVKISKTYLFYIIKNKLKITYKQLRKKYYPEKKLVTLRKDKIQFYKTIIEKIKKI